MTIDVQLFMNALEFSIDGSLDILIFGVECFLECLFSLSKGFCLSFVGLDVGGKIVELFLGEGEVLRWRRVYFLMTCSYNLQDMILMIVRGKDN